MKYTDKELQRMWAMAEKDIYTLRELAKKTKYKFQGFYGIERKYATKLEAMMYKYTDKDGNRI
jgi:hypothetical protein